MRQLAEALEAEVAFVAEMSDTKPSHVRLLATWPFAHELSEGHEVPITALTHEVGVPLLAGDGTMVGHLAIMGGRARDAGDDEISVLHIFAARAAAEIERRHHHAAMVHRDAEIAAARARQVEVADEERRRIGRDLHDGAQQRLVALTYWIEQAKRKVPEDPEEATRLLAEAAEQAGDAARELREMARGLHPSGLADHGLSRALPALAASSPVPLRILGLPDRRLPDVVEATVWFLACEALSNAVKHANASRVTIEVAHRASTIVVDVADDGDGGATSDGGSGLSGLNDRVEALGGRLRVDSPRGDGTRLVATIPLGQWRTAREPFLEFGFDGDGGQGEERIGEVLSGRRTASVSLAREWDLEGGPPRIGQVLPVIHHTGRRHGAVEVTKVAAVPFSQVDESVLEARAVGAEDLAEWSAHMRRFYDGCREEISVLLGDPGWRLTEDEPMVICWFQPVAVPAA